MSVSLCQGDSGVCPTERLRVIMQDTRRGGLGWCHDIHDNMDTVSRGVNITDKLKKRLCWSDGVHDISLIIFFGKIEIYQEHKPPNW